MPINPVAIADKAISVLISFVRWSGKALKTGNDLSYEKKMNQQLGKYDSEMIGESGTESHKETKRKLFDFFKRGKKKDTEQEYIIKFMGKPRSDDSIFIKIPKVIKPDIQAESIEPMQVSTENCTMDSNRESEINDFVQELISYSVLSDRYYDREMYERNGLIKEYNKRLADGCDSETLDEIYNPRFSFLLYDDFECMFNELDIDSYIDKSFSEEFNIQNVVAELQEKNMKLQKENKVSLEYDFIKIIEAGKELEIQRREKINIIQEMKIHKNKLEREYNKGIRISSIIRKYKHLFDNPSDMTHIIIQYSKKLLNRECDIGEAIDEIKIVMNIHNINDYKREVKKSIYKISNIGEAIEKLENELTEDIKVLLTDEILRILSHEVKELKLPNEKLFDAIKKRPILIEDLQSVLCRATERTPDIYEE